MDLRLSDEQRAVRATFAALFRKESTPRRVRIAESTGLDEALWRSYSAIEAFGIGIPSEHGGADGGLLELALVAEEAGRRLAPIPVAETAAAARLLARLGEKELLAPVLNGSNIVSLATRGGPVGDQLLVDGAIADAVLAFDGESLLYVTRPDGQPIIPRRNLGGLALARWDVDATSRSLAEGEQARTEFAAALDEVRVLRAAALVGLAAEAVHIGSEYTKVRKAFGQPIGMYQAVAHPFADALSALDGAELLVHKACWALDSGQDNGPALATMAFIFAAETAYQASQHSLHVHGGYGFTEEYDVQLYYRRAKAWAVAFADPRRELLVLADRRFVPRSREVTEEMDFTEPANWTRIQSDAEAFVAEHVTREVIENERRTGDGVDRVLTRKLGERGWVAPTWPLQEGGAALDAFEAAVLLDTLRKGGVPTIGPGTTMLPASAIKATGSEELKARILPGVVAGETLICLGYTEPAGGSDVFACATRSEQDGDEWVVNGQKIFTTFAHVADYCFLLTRSQAGSVGTRGLTMLLVPLDSRGIEIQPVHTMGHERTNVVFYNDVRVADTNRIGEAHQGFSVMRAALEAEQNVAPGSRTRRIAIDTLEFARTQPGPDGAPLINDHLVRERLARMAMEAEVADLLGLRVAFLDTEGEKPGPVSALFGPESYVRASAAAIDIAGLSGLLDWTDPEAAVDGSIDAHYRSAVATTIYGGSSEVLRSLIVENRLGLPRSRPRR